jgi:sortase A
MTPRDPHDFSVEELERLLAAKRRTVRQERIRRFGRSGRTAFHQPPPPPEVAVPEGMEAAGEKKPNKRKAILDRLLLVVEVAAVFGLGVILLQGVRLLQNLNHEVVASILATTPSPTPLITAVVLPSGHTPPNSPGGPAPNEAEIPAELRPLMQSYLAQAIPTRGAEQAIRLDLTSLGKINLLVVEGDNWEQLRQGIGHHIGSADPGSGGNVVLSGHNDIYGEPFRDLDRLEPGAEVVLHTASRRYVYRVIGVRIVPPTDISVLAPTARPTLTLISCYPYMIDNQRIVVTADLTSVQ